DLGGETLQGYGEQLGRLVKEPYKERGTASACGIVQPGRGKEPEAACQAGPLKEFLATHQDFAPREQSLRERFNRSITNFYRGILYTFLQRFIYRGQMVVFGSIINPVGCAVAYRRKYLKELFDYYEPIRSEERRV